MRGKATEKRRRLFKKRGLKAEFRGRRHGVLKVLHLCRRPALGDEVPLHHPLAVEFQNAAVGETVVAPVRPGGERYLSFWKSAKLWSGFSNQPSG